MVVRNRKSPAEKAQEAYDVAQRLIEKLQAKHRKLYTELDQVRADLDQAIKRRDYALRNPDLPAQEVNEEATIEESAKLADMEAEIDAQNYQASKGMDEPAGEYVQALGSISEPPWERVEVSDDPDGDNR